MWLRWMKEILTIELLFQKDKLTLIVIGILYGLTKVTYFNTSNLVWEESILYRHNHVVLLKRKQPTTTSPSLYSVSFV